MLEWLLKVTHGHQQWCQSSFLHCFRNITTRLTYMTASDLEQSFNLVRTILQLKWICLDNSANTLLSYRVPNSLRSLWQTVEQHYLQVNRAEVRLTLDSQRSPDILMYILADTNPDMPTKYTTVKHYHLNVSITINQQ